MKTSTKKIHQQVATPEALGGLARSCRKAKGLTLAKASVQANQSVRFLSEFERGKATSEIGKVFDALHTIGLELAVVSQEELNMPGPTDAAEATAQGNHYSVVLSLTESEFLKLQAQAKAQGFDSIAALTMDMYRDLFALASDDPYLAVTKRAAQLKEKLEARLGKISPDDTMLIPRDVVKKSKVEL